MNSDYQAVTDQSGFFAGKGGYTIDVAKNGEIGVRPRFAFKELSWLLFCSLKRELSEEWCVVRRLFFLSLIMVV
jgi:hypothetical protein